MGDNPEEMSEDEFKKVIVEGVVECTDAIIKVFKQKLSHDKGYSAKVTSSIVLNCANNIMALWLEGMAVFLPGVLDIDKFEKTQLAVIRELCQRKRKNLHPLR